MTNNLCSTLDTVLHNPLVVYNQPKFTDKGIQVNMALGSKKAT